VGVGGVGVGLNGDVLEEYGGVAVGCGDGASLRLVRPLHDAPMSARTVATVSIPMRGGL
jgi:hypothetical protein